MSYESLYRFAVRIDGRHGDYQEALTVITLSPTYSVACSYSTGNHTILDNKVVLSAFFKLLLLSTGSRCVFSNAFIEIS
jgi:hypothetical protein